jgi:hypothetical protein
MGFLQPRVLELLNDDQFDPCQCSRSLRLFPDDRFLRMQLCEWLHQYTEVRSFHANFLLTDEARFEHGNVFNFHSSHYWALDNPHGIREHG